MLLIYVIVYVCVDVPRMLILHSTTPLMSNIFNVVNYNRDTYDNFYVRNVGSSHDIWAIPKWKRLLLSLICHGKPEPQAV
jgi:hypothetical protein